MTGESSVVLRSWITDYGPRLKSLARRMLMDEAAAEDVLQETLEAAWKAWDSFEGRSSVGTWLYRIAVNRILKEKERLQRGAVIARDLESLSGSQTAFQNPWQEAGIGEPERELAEREIAQEIQERCHWYTTFLLTPEQRSAFLLREVAELEYAEIAEVLEVSTDVVRSRLKRARDRLQKHLASHCSLVNPENPCRCENRLPYVLAKYPGILEKYKRRMSTEEIHKRLEVLSKAEKLRFQQKNVFSP